MRSSRNAGSRSETRALLLLVLAVVPILMTSWFSLNQWRDAGQELDQIARDSAPTMAGYFGYEIFDRIAHSELLIEAASLPEPPATVLDLVAEDQASISIDIRTALDAFEPHVATFSAQLNQTEEATNNLLSAAAGLPQMAITDYRAGQTAPFMLDLILRPTRGGLADVVPIFLTSDGDNAHLLRELILLDNDHDLDLLHALRGELDAGQALIADRRLPRWDLEVGGWSMQLKAIEGDTGFTEIRDVGTLAQNDNPLMPPLEVLVELGLDPSPDRDAAILEALANDIDLREARQATYEQFVEAYEQRVAALGRGRLVAMIAGFAITGLAFLLLALVLAEVNERRRVARAHEETLSELAELANSDALTGLHNRRWLDQALPRLLDQRAPGDEVVLAYIDVDRFKTINDVWGHHNGDKLLRIVAQRLRVAAERIPGFELVRFGGDEFVGVTIMPRSVADDRLNAIGQKLLEAFAKPVALDDKQHDIESSIGIALSNADSTVQTLLVDADLSMLQAKRSGRGRVVVDQRGDSAVSELVQMLPGAIANNEFSMHLQPVVDVATGDVCHYEALARWTRPNGDEVAPSVFVPLIESFGLADDLTQTMFGHVARLRREHGPDMPRIWVNVSPVEFNGADLGRRILDRLAELDIPPEAIGIEMTERSAIGDLVGVEDELQRLRSHGVHVAIDDFGAGYSPLGHLRDLPVDILKIDRSLIAGIDMDPGALQIVRGIIGFARSLGMRLVAEGVETEAERDVLAGEGIRLVQGWLTGRPGPADDVLSSRLVSD